MTSLASTPPSSLSINTIISTDNGIILDNSSSGGGSINEIMAFRSKNSSTPISPSSLPSSPRSPRLSRPHSPMHIDLSSLPPLITPSPPSNTLLITNLTNPQTFSAPTLQTIRSHLDNPVPLHSFSPLKSLRRIIVSYPTVDAAVAVRQALDGTDILGDRCRIYFGEPTPIHDPTHNHHLKAPTTQKLFFISPPPSPPQGWTMRNEEPPNKAVHADDLANALAGLRAKANPNLDEMEGVERSPTSTKERSRSGSATLVFKPEEHGGSPGLPAVMVEDTTEEEDEADDENKEESEKKIMAHTARPPVELME